MHILLCFFLVALAMAGSGLRLSPLMQGRMVEAEEDKKDEGKDVGTRDISPFPKSRSPHRRDASDYSWHHSPARPLRHGVRNRCCNSSFSRNRKKQYAPAQHKGATPHHSNDGQIGEGPAVDAVLSEVASLATDPIVWQLIHTALEEIAYTRKAKTVNWKKLGMKTKQNYLPVFHEGRRNKHGNRRGRSRNLHHGDKYLVNTDIDNRYSPLDYTDKSTGIASVVAGFTFAGTKNSSDVFTDQSLHTENVNSDAWAREGGRDYFTHRVRDVMKLNFQKENGERYDGRSANSSDRMGKFIFHKVYLGKKYGSRREGTRNGHVTALKLVMPEDAAEEHNGTDQRSRPR